MVTRALVVGLFIAVAVGGVLLMSALTAEGRLFLAQYVLTVAASCAVLATRETS